jgi:hypothetical protein
VTRSTTVEVPLRTHGHVDGQHHALAVIPPVFDVEDVAPVSASREVSALMPAGHFTGHPACTDRAVRCRSSRSSPPVPSPPSRSGAAGPPDAVCMVVEVSVSGWSLVEVEAMPPAVRATRHP